MVLSLDIDIVEDAVQSVDLSMCTRGSMLSKHLVSTVPNELLLVHHRRVWACRMLTTLFGSADWNGRKVLSAKIWLQLLKKDEYQCDLIFFFEVLDRSILDFLQVKVHVFVAF